MLARACALVGALVAGGYLGYALSWVGVSAELADQRVVRSLVAALAGVVRGGHSAAPRASVSRPEGPGRHLAWLHVFPQGSSSAAQHPPHASLSPCHHRVALAVIGAVLAARGAPRRTAAVLGVALGAAATRITHSELMQARRDASRDRAEQAQAYRELTDERTTEHAAYVAGMERQMTAHQDQPSTSSRTP